MGYLVRGLLPPTGFDGLMYHLSTVKLYLNNGGFFDIYYNPQSDFPMLTEMHYMIGIVFNNDIISKTISTGLLFYLLLTIYKLSEMLEIPKRYRIWSIIIFSMTPIIIANGSNCDVDIAQALWTVIAIILAIYYHRFQKTSLLILTSLFCGMALQSKIFGVFAIPVIITCLVYGGKDFKLSINKLKQITILLIISLLMGAVWHSKAFIYNSSVLNYVNNSQISSDLNTFPFILENLYSFIKRIILSPWSYTLFTSHHRGDTTGSLFLTILPFLFLTKKNHTSKILLLASATFILQVLFMDHFFLKTMKGSSGRYIITVLALLSPVIIYTVVNINKQSIKKFLWLLIIVPTLLNCLIFLKRYHKEWIAFLTLKNRDKYLQATLPEYEVCKKINKLNDNKKILLAYNFSQYLIDKPHIVAYKKYDDTLEMIKDLNSINIGYIFANNKLDTLENKRSFSQLKEYMEPIYSANGFYLYKLSIDLNGDIK